MAQIQSIAQDLLIGKLAIYLAGNANSKLNAFQGGNLDQRLPKMLCMEQYILQNIYDLNPSDPNLRQATSYLYYLYGIYGQIALNRLNQLAQSPPTITNPNSISILVGQAAVFTVTVTSALPYTAQWYRNGVAISGATSTTYTLTNAQLSDSGAHFSATATNAAGSVSSASATLTVSSVIVALAWYGTTDPYPALSGGTDTLNYQITQNITHNNPITITWPLASANNQYEVLKVPIGESVKTAWFNTALNSGVLDPTGDSVWRASITFGGYRYYISRVAMSLDSTVLTETFS